MRRRIDLHIEELVLEGVAPHDRFRVVAALRSELARRVLDGGLPGNLTRLSGGDLVGSPPLRLSPQQGPAAVGRAVAGGVYRALEGGGR